MKQRGGRPDEEHGAEVAIGLLFHASTCASVLSLHLTAPDRIRLVMHGLVC